ncbi:MAG: GNAT family N-acetyltransferase [Nakamurella sp.]
MTADGPWVRESLVRSWGSTMAARCGALVDASALPAVIVMLDGQLAGLATYAARGEDWELVTIAADTIGRGIGRMLINAVEDLAMAAKARRIWLVTTNDNTRALRFYQRSGYDLVALDRDAVTRVRATLKPTIPLTIDGIAVRHELRLEKVLQTA